MSSSKGFKDYILEQLANLNFVSCKPMMGEFLLYYNNILFGGIYDDRFLIKITNSNKNYNLKTQIPYKNAKPMYIIENLEDTYYLCEIIQKTCKDLKRSSK